VTRRLQKFAQILEKVAITVAKTQKREKAQFESPKHQQQTTFKHVQTNHVLNLLI
jgi:hypothetical protein